MDRTRFFQPDAPPRDEEGGSRDDQGVVYDFDEATALAVDVAIVTGRPLLVRGPPGCGKSTLAPAVARRMGWGWLEHVVTSRTQAQDLLWTFDEVRRLSDATAGQVKDEAAYVTPGPLWWALAPEQVPDGATSPVRQFAARDDLPEGPAWPGMVLLLDEIDKADPDVPNDLLGVLSTRSFAVRGHQEPVRAKHAPPPLVVITTNDERDLPGAFRRRCVQVDLPAPPVDRLVAIARAHIRHGAFQASDAVVAALAAHTFTVGEEQRRRGLRAPGTSELLDALVAFAKLGLTDLTSDAAKQVLSATLEKAG